MKKQDKTLSIRLPLVLWRAAMIAKAKGKIKSLQDAIVQALEEYLKKT